MSMSMDTKHYTTTSSENTAPVQEAVDLALYEAAKDGDLHAAFIAVQKGANPSSQHDIVRHAPLRLDQIPRIPRVAALVVTSQLCRRRPFPTTKG